MTIQGTWVTLPPSWTQEGAFGWNGESRRVRRGTSDLRVGTSLTSDFSGMGTSRHPLKVVFFTSIYAFIPMADANSPEHIRSHHTCIVLFAHV